MTDRTIQIPTKTCSVIRPFYGFVVPNTAGRPNGLTIAGGAQGVQTFQVNQLNANSHELRPLPGQDIFDTPIMIGMYCIYCCLTATIEDWQEIQAGPDA